MKTKMLGVAAATSLLLAGCASQLPAEDADGPAGAAAELAGKTFVWAEAAVEEGDRAPSITFGADGRVSGNAGCNNLIGGWTLEGKTLTFGPMGATMKMCGPGAMKNEQAFLGFLNETVYATAEGDRLTLWSKDERALVTLTAGK